MFELSPFDLPDDYAEGIVTLADVKSHLSLDESEDEFDSLLAIFRSAAIDMVEQYCGVRLSACTGLVWRADALPDPLLLGSGPVSAVTAFAYLDTSGDEQTVDVTTLRVGPRNRLLPKPSVSWPSDIGADVQITFDAGFTAATRPAALVQAVLLFTGHLFANREAVITGTISGEIPLGFQALCRAHRMPML